jgi:hypothetical protein
MKLSTTPRRILALQLAGFFIIANLLTILPASAATLTNTSLRLNRMSSGTSTSLRLVFRTVSSGATSVAINMNGADTTTWTGSSGVVNATQSVSSASCATDTGATALPGTITAAGATSTITISSVTALSATTSYCVDLTSASAVTNPSAGEYHPTITVGSDSTTTVARIVSNDQVVVTAVVPPTFNFAIGGCGSNADTFTTTLSASAVTSTNGCTVTINTNAKTGWFAWAKDSNTGLTSATASKTISATTPGTSTTLTAGTEGYVLGITSITQGSGAGTTSAATAYDATASSGNNANGSGLDGTIRQIASSTGTANGAVITVKERATIAAITPAAGDYTDTITLIGAGNF